MRIMEVVPGLEALAAGASLAAGGLLAWSVRGRTAQVFGASVWRGSVENPAVALTFDDGPSESTPQLLEVLERHRAKATFFMCGRNARRCPAIARQVCAAGHEIGNHTETHPRFDFKSPGFILREMAAAQKSIVEITGATPRWFRAPYGVRWYGVGAAQKRLGLTGVMWTAIGRDWRWPGERVAARLLAAASNGAIFCLHDGRTMQARPDIRATLDAVGQVIPQLRDQGFEFVTVGQLLRPCPV